MRDVISNETIKEINEVIDEILTNIDNNVRNIQIGEGAITLPTLLSYTNYDGRTYNIHGSTFTHHIIIDDANGRTTGHIEDGDILTTVGDKNGRQIGAVDEKISGYSNYAYFRESLYSVATDSYGYEFDKRIPFDIARNYDSGITGFSFDIRERYNEHSISNESCTVMTYKLTNIPVGSTFTVTFRGQFHGDFLEDKDSYIVINEHFDETGITIPMPIGDASVEIIKDDQTHNYSITCTNSTQFTDLYLHFYFKVDSFVAFDVDSFLVSGMDLGVIGSSFYHDGESYSFLQGGGGGTSDLDAIELTYAEYQALTPAEKTDPDKIYFITDYPSGSGVVINPTGTATDTAETIEVDGTIYDFAGTDADAVHTADIGVAGGVAELDANGKVPSAQLPTYPTVGDGTITIQKNGTNVDTFSTNQSSNKTVNITMSKRDVGLGNVDNTSDANKPISTATQAALDGKADASDIDGIKTVTGNPLTLTDGSETYAEELSVDLEPIQDLHGYDKPWVGGAGKNLLDVADKSSFTSGYIFQGKSLKAGTYTYSFNSSVTGSNAQFNILVDSTTIATKNLVVGLNQLTFTLDSDVDDLRSYCNISVSAKITNIQIEKGSSATTYEPYSNISPIQGYDIVSVDRCGKNLFDPSQLFAVAGLSVTDGVYRFSKENMIAVFGENTGGFYPRKFKENTQYTISLKGYTERSGWVIVIKHTDGTSVSNTSYATSMTAFSLTSGVNKTVKEIYFTYQSYGVTYWKEIQLEEGSTATTYEPYNGQNVSLQLGNKNLLPMTVEGIKAANTSGTWSGNVYTLSGVTITVLTDSDGNVTGIKMNGTSTATIFFIIASALSFINQTILNGNRLSNPTASTCLRFIDSGGTSYDDLGNGVTIPSNFTGQVQFRINSGYTANNVICYPMLRSASVTDPTFSPYNPTLGGMVYGGQLTLKDDGSAVFVGDKASVDLGSFEWDYNNSTNHEYFITTTTLPNSKSTTNDTIYNAICSGYKLDTHTNVYNHTQDGIISVTRLNVVSIYDTNSIGMTASQFKSYVTGQQLVYELATPITIHLSAEQFKLLQGTNNVWSNAGDVTLKYQPDNVIAEPKADVQRLRDDVNDRLVGNACRNIFDPTKLAGKYDSGFTSNYDATTHKLTLTGKWYGYWICRVNPNTDYAFSAKLISATITTNCNIYKSDGTVVGSDLLVGGSFNNQSDFTFNSGDTNYVAILLYSGTNSSGTTVLQNIQLEIGSSPTAYEEYYPSNVELYNKTAELQKGINKCFDIPTYATAYVDLKPYTAQNMYKCPADGIVVISINQGETGFLGFAIYPGVVIKEVYGSADHVVRDYAIVKKGMSLYHRGSANGTLNYYYNNY